MAKVKIKPIFRFRHFGGFFRRTDCRRKGSSKEDFSSRFSSHPITASSHPTLHPLCILTLTLTTLTLGIASTLCPARATFRNLNLNLNPIPSFNPYPNILLLSSSLSAHSTHTLFLSLTLSLPSPRSLDLWLYFHTMPSDILYFHQRVGCIHREHDGSTR